MIKIKLNGTRPHFHPTSGIQLEPGDNIVPEDVAYVLCGVSVSGTAASEERLFEPADDEAKKQLVAFHEEQLEAAKDAQKQAEAGAKKEAAEKAKKEAAEKKRQELKAKNLGAANKAVKSKPDKAEVK